MAPLTQAQVDSLVAELQPHIASKDKRVELGVCAYRALFGAKPEYIQYFSKISGLNKDNVFQSEGIKYYGGTLVDDLVNMVTVAAKDSELEKALVKSGKDHTSRKITKEQFLSGEPIFIDFFNKTLTKPENKAAMEAFLKHAFPVIANNI